MEGDILKKFEISEKIIELIKKNGREIALNNGEYLFHENDKATSAYLLLQGTLEVLKNDEKGSLRAINRTEPVSFIGEMGLFQGNRRTASIRALSKAQLIEVDYKTFLKIVSKIPQISLNIMSEFSERLSQCNENLLSYSDFRQKIISTGFLLDLSKKEKRESYKINLNDVENKLKISKSEFLKTLFFLEKYKVAYSIDMFDKDIVTFKINHSLIEKYFFKLIYQEL